MKPLDLIKTARRLVGRKGRRRPPQSDLKRAISSAYYALFHTMCANCADLLIGTGSANRSRKAWLQAYRAVDHGYAKSQCKNSEVISKFPKEIEDFANQFIELQIERHKADYDPSSRYTLTEVHASIDAAEQAIKMFKRAPLKDRRAFAAWTALRVRDRS
ncbi:hypothetical protein [Meinhardsimonia xiamenensis]|uniref:hypothetical protein n=1 Tax=Meinhardsimonia xiamenensis TaxID=990712 RepID=UPI001C06F863|nr:hypothetical protein [Meinhardsimonia xiamenensis]